jgi:hypothetical protein
VWAARVRLLLSPSKLHLNKSHRPSIARAATFPNFTQRATIAAKNGPFLSSKTKMDAVLQGESDLAQLREIILPLLSIGVFNGQDCEQARDYFAKSKSPSG